MKDHESEQRAVCARHGAPFEAAPDHLKVGIADNVRTGGSPIHGLRHRPEGDTTGWYIWAGEEPDEADDFFKPLHVSHLDDCFPGLRKSSASHRAGAS